MDTTNEIIARIREAEEQADASGFYDPGQVLSDALELAERIESARAAILRIWPKGKDCEHQAAREAFQALGGSPNPTDHQAPASGALVHPVVGQTSQENDHE